MILLCFFDQLGPRSREKIKMFWGMNNLIGEWHDFFFVYFFQGSHQFVRGQYVCSPAENAGPPHRVIQFLIWLILCTYYAGGRLKIY